MFSSATKDAANEAISDAKNATQNAKRDLREVSKDSRAELSQYAEKAGRDAREFIESARGQFDQAGQRIGTEIRENPLRSSAIALGIGVLLGALIRR